MSLVRLATATGVVAIAIAVAATPALSNEVLCSSVPPVESSGIEGADAANAATFIQKNADFMNLQVVWMDDNQEALCATMTVTEVYKVRDADSGSVSVAYHTGHSDVWGFTPGTSSAKGKIENGEMMLRLGTVRIKVEREEGEYEALWRGRGTALGIVNVLPLR